MDFDKKAREAMKHITPCEYACGPDDFCACSAHIAAALREAYNAGLEDAAECVTDDCCEWSACGCSHTTKAEELRAKKVPT